MRDPGRRGGPRPAPPRRRRAARSPRRSARRSRPSSPTCRERAGAGSCGPAGGGCGSAATPLADGHRQRHARLVLRRRRAARPRRARGPRARARRGGRADRRHRRRVRVRRPPDRSPAEEEIDARRAASSRRSRPSSTCSSPSTPTSRRWPRRRSRRARSIVNDVSGLRDPGSPRSARRPAPRSCSCTRACAPKGTLLDPGFYDDVVADVRDLLAERLARAEAAGVHPEQLLLDPGPGLRQDAGADRRRAARGWTSCTRSAVRCCSPVSRKDFLGAITGRRAARAAGGDARRGRLGRRRGRPRAARPRRRAAPPTSSPCAPCCAASACSMPAAGPHAGALPRRRAAAVRAAQRLPGCTGCRPLRTTRPGAIRPTEGAP